MSRTLRTSVPAGAWAALAIGLALGLVGCSPSSSSSPGGARSGGELVASAEATRKDITGTVVKVDAAARQVTLAHEAIPGYMEAMTMAFTVKEPWAFQALQPGDTLRGTLIVDGARTWIEGISISKAGSPKTVPQGTWTPPAAGTPLPAVTLADQDAKPFTWSRFRGAPLVLTFIYTRCPLPDYCPLMMQRFAALEKAVTVPGADPAVARTRLLTISIDPAYDTPSVLRAFGRRYAAGGGTGRAGSGDRFSRWTLATGDPAEVKRLAAFFGLDYFADSGQITHALRTAIVDPQGGVYKVFQGNAWTVEEIVHGLRASAHGDDQDRRNP